MIGLPKWNNLHEKRKRQIAGDCMGVLNEGCEKSTQLLPGNGRNRQVPWGNWDFLHFYQPRHQDVEGHKRLMPCVLQLHWGRWKGQTDRWLLTWGSGLADVEETAREMLWRKNPGECVSCFLRELRGPRAEDGETHQQCEVVRDGSPELWCGSEEFLSKQQGSRLLV